MLQAQLSPTLSWSGTTTSLSEARLVKELCAKGPGGSPACCPGYNMQCISGGLMPLKTLRWGQAMLTLIATSLPRCLQTAHSQACEYSTLKPDMATATQGQLHPPVFRSNLNADSAC